MSTIDQQKLVTEEFKERVVSAIKAQKGAYPSGKKHAIALGIAPGQYSRILNGDIDQVVSAARWISMARRLNVQFSNEGGWKVVKTDVFEQCTDQLAACQDGSLSAILCDLSDIGKSFAAKYYVRSHGGAVYIDCSQTKSKQKLVRAIAKEMGLENSGTYNEVYDDLTYYLRIAKKPLIILDEAGDLQYDAFLELKALWNASEGNCGWYMIGADGLRKKIEDNLNRKKVGYAEIFSRFGNKYQRFTPLGAEERRIYLEKQAAMIARANGAKSMQTLIRDVFGSGEGRAGAHRRIRIEVNKQKIAA